MKYWEIEELVNKLYALADRKIDHSMTGALDSDTTIEAYIMTSFKTEAAEIIKEYVYDR